MSTLVSLSCVLLIIFSLYLGSLRDLEEFEGNSWGRVHLKEAKKLGFVINLRGVNIALYLSALVSED